MNLASWSYSRWQCWQNCPRQAKYKFIDKIPAPKSPEMELGIRVHKECADYLQGNLTEPPESIKAFGVEMFDALKAFNPKVESQYAFNYAWEPTDWFAYDAWVRVIFDVEVDYDDEHALIIDHKTGKVREDSSEQMSLFALAKFRLNRKLKEVETRLWYLSTGDEVVEVFTSNDVQRLDKLWRNRVIPMLNDTKFPPTPSHLCNWCPYSHKRGGPCDVA